MNTATLLQNDAARRLTWKDIRVTDRRSLRRALKAKYGTLTRAAEAMEIDYTNFNHVVSGRRCTIKMVAALQQSMDLTDAQVLALWPLLKTWPREIN